MTEETAQEQTQGPLIEWDVNKAAIAKVAEEFKDIDAYKDLDSAKTAKKTLVKMRTTLAEAHKVTKSDALAFGRRVDAAKNELEGLIRKIENPIGDQLDEIKNAEAKKEEERVGKIMAEIERIQAFSLDRHSLTIPQLEERRETLLNTVLDPELLEEYIEDAKLALDEADLKLRLAIDRETQEQKEREEKAELERKNAEQEAEIQKLRDEQAERDREAQEKTDAELEEQRKKDASEREEQEKKDAARQKELDDQQALIDQQNKDLQDEADRIAAEEKRVEEEAEAQKIRDLQAPDIDKLAKYADAIDHLIGLKPVMGSHQGNVVLLSTVAGLVNTHNTLKHHIEEMK